MIRSLRASTLGAVLVAGALALTSRASAQELATAQAAGPTLAAASVGFRPTLHEASPDEALLQRRGGLSSGQKLMILGGATFLVGALVGDDAGTVIMVGGAVIGLYGLYLWLNEGAVGVGTSIPAP
ncbi:MAG TPA: hypothetical protein VJ672_14870 [Gemmatimonadaceae bacterium]|nr:hypothetical protein [Gemmatimonadaceae bacterium]